MKGGECERWVDKGMLEYLRNCPKAIEYFKNPKRINQPSTNAFIGFYIFFSRRICTLNFDTTSNVLYGPHTADAWHVLQPIQTEVDITRDTGPIVDITLDKNLLIELIGGNVQLVPSDTFTRCWAVASDLFSWLTKQ